MSKTPTMRAKMVINAIEQHSDCLTLHLNAVCKSQYNESGADEDNTFARWTPSADLQIIIANPNLLHKFKKEQTFYVDFTEVE